MNLRRLWLLKRNVIDKILTISDHSVRNWMESPVLIGISEKIGTHWYLQANVVGGSKKYTELKSFVASFPNPYKCPKRSEDKQ